MSTALHTPRRALLAALFAFALAALVSAPGAFAAAAPTFTLTAVPAPSNFTPGATNEVLLVATNVGGAATDASPTVFEVTLPAGFEATSASSELRTTSGVRVQPPCTILAQTSISCETTASIPPGRSFGVTLGVGVVGSPSETEMDASITGGGAQSVSLTRSLPVQSSPVPFDIVTGLNAPLLGADSTTASLAGAHPFQQVLDFGFPMIETEGGTGARLFASSGHPREIIVDMPRGMVVNPSATPVRCTEVELLDRDCPAASQLGNFNLASIVGTEIGYFTNNIYNMVPPPGYPAELAFDPTESNGIFIHVLGAVRSDGDFGIQALVRDVPALGTNPVFNDYTQLWGDPSAGVHSETRASCTEAHNPPVGPCLVEHQRIPLLTTPPDCSGQPLDTTVRVDSWEEPDNFKSATYLSSDLQGNPVALSGCNQLSYEPTISVQPTTNLADSPSGLDVVLHQPQEAPHPEPLSGRATGELENATVTLPPGLVANPSQADGLGACTEAEMGFLAEKEGVHFSKQPDSCPDAAKLGTVEVTTPLLAEYVDGGTRRVDDPETGAPIPRPLDGSVYLAKPFDNPFGSLLAIYLSINDPRSGTIAKIAGRVEPDPQTGQLTTVFEENPELPLEDIGLHLFGGARASLITPPTCGSHTTITNLVPWSAPETADAEPKASFETTALPGGGACPATADKAPNAPTFSAGTLAPQAGAYTPFALKLSREDGSQRLTGFDTLLPPGLTGKLAGVAECSDARIAQAQARSNPEEGALERQQPSCPDSSKLGTVNVGAGAGPTPFYAQGTAYLAGPYEGAPLSMVVITPAIAGPFDLGTVVVRAALYVDPASARIHAVSDPFPTILHGIPLDLRSVAVNLDRPSFTLNPTSCDAMAITGAATSAVGQIASLNARFQVGGCSSLKFKPKLSLKLTGGTRRSKNPALRATLTMLPGGANIASASVSLPHSEFLDQAHIRTICTRVQFAEAGGNGAGCPPGSVYGKARAFTPLLNAPLEGPVYLRSNGGERLLPDLVAALHGQIEVDLTGRIDSHKGGIRTTFEGVPDAPVSKFVLQMQGGKKGLLQNSTNLCKATNWATALFDGQNGKAAEFQPLVRNSCKGESGKKRRQRH